jgi:hypothetical protein
VIKGDFHEYSPHPYGMGRRNACTGSGDRNFLR